MVTPFLFYVGYTQPHKYFRYGLWGVGIINGINAIRGLTTPPESDTPTE